MFFSWGAGLAVGMDHGTWHVGVVFGRARIAH